MKHFIMIGVSYIQKLKTKAPYIALLLLIIAGIVFFMKTHEKMQEMEKNLPTQEEKQMLEYKKRAEFSKSEKHRSQQVIDFEKDNLEKHFKLMDCYIEQMERIVEGLEVKENYCDEIYGEEHVQNMINTGSIDHVVESNKKVEEVVQEKKTHSGKVHRKDWNEDDPRQEYINIVYDAIGKDALLTFTGENTFWTIERPSTNTGFDGNRAYGFCQLYYTYHKDFINSKEFQDPYKQLEYCIGVWKDAKKRGIIATTFQAYPTRSKWLYLFDFR